MTWTQSHGLDILKDSLSNANSINIKFKNNIM